MRIKALLLCATFVCASSRAAEVQVASPDGKLVVTVADEGGRPTYGVTYDGVIFLETSPLGLRTDFGDFTSGMALDESAFSSSQVAVSYELSTIKCSKVDKQAVEAVCPFLKDGKRVYDVVFHVSANDVAFKYKLYPQDGMMCCIIKEEASGFTLPAGTTTFLCPQVKPMGGFARTYPSYETSYTADGELGQNGGGQGYTFPCLFRCGDNGWVLLSETGLDSRYCACRLLCDGSTYTIGFPQEGEFNGNGSACPGIALPGETPWRTITVGSTLAPIVKTTIPFDVTAQRYEPSCQYIHGRGTWSWIIGGDATMTYEDQKRYVDFAADMGYESVLVDAWWDSRLGRDGIATLAQYAAGKGVGLYLWYNSNGFWNDAPQGPRGCMDNIIVRRKEMKWMQSVGIRGIKVDFIGSDKQQTIQFYEEVLADANDYGLLVIYHGCTLPRGWERMYPNFVASEAVLASENMNFSQGSCDNEAFNACLHPFIRNTVASMDFGGSTLNKYYNVKNETGGSQRVTSDVFALATAVLFQSSVQHFALAPNNLNDAPDWAIDFMKNVPTTWDDIRFIDGYPGKYVILARRHGDKWYVAGVNAQKETLKTEVALPMFPAGTALKMYADNDKLEGGVREVKAGKKQTVKVTIPCNGGVLLMN